MIHEMRRGGITIGSHTRSHVSLPAETPADVKDELEGSKRMLEARARRADRSLRLSRRPVHAARRRARCTRPAIGSRYTACPHGDATHPDADDRAAAAVGRLVGRRRRRVLVGHPQLPDPRSVAAGAPLRADASRMSRFTRDAISRPAFLLVVGRTDRLRGVVRHPRAPRRARSTRRSSAPTSSSSWSTRRSTASRSSAWPRASTTSCRASRRRHGPLRRQRDHDAGPRRHRRASALLWLAGRSHRRVAEQSAARRPHRAARRVPDVDARRRPCSRS